MLKYIYLQKQSSFPHDSHNPPRLIPRCRRAYFLGQLAAPEIRAQYFSSPPTRRVFSGRWRDARFAVSSADRNFRVHSEDPRKWRVRPRRRERTGTGNEKQSANGAPATCRPDVEGRNCVSRSLPWQTRVPISAIARPATAFGAAKSRDSIARQSSPAGAASVSYHAFLLRSRTRTQIAQITAACYHVTIREQSLLPTNRAGNLGVVKRFVRTRCVVGWRSQHLHFSSLDKLPKTTHDCRGFR